MVRTRRYHESAGILSKLRARLLYLSTSISYGASKCCVASRCVKKADTLRYIAPDRAKKPTLRYVAKPERWTDAPRGRRARRGGPRLAGSVDARGTDGCGAGGNCAPGRPPTTPPDAARGQPGAIRHIARTGPCQYGASRERLPSALRRGRFHGIDKVDRLPQPMLIFRAQISKNRFDCAGFPRNQFVTITKQTSTTHAHRHSTKADLPVTARSGQMAGIPGISPADLVDQPADRCHITPMSRRHTPHAAAP
jgi:hypothetical protein